MLDYLKLDDSATVKDVCNGLQKVLDSELENQKKQSQSGVLPKDDPNNLWINECKKENVTMNSLMKIVQSRFQVFQDPYAQNKSA